MSIIKTTEEVYYGDSEVWGDSQYVTLEEIVNDYIMSRVSGDHTENIPRHKILYWAMQGVREMIYSIVQEIKTYEIELSPTLFIPLPPDYIKMVSVGFVDEEGQLHYMAEDDRRSTADEILQDANFDYTYDDDGDVLLGESHNRPDVTKAVPDDGSTEYPIGCGTNFTPNIDASRIFPNGSFIINKTKGTVDFSSNVVTKFVVIQYVGDPLYQNAKSNGIKVHLYARNAVIDYIYYNLVKNDRNTPVYEKQRSRKEYFNSRRAAKLKIAAQDIQTIKNNMLKANKWVK